MLTQLYGGAITADIMDGMLDGSKVRPVPDTQEVFTGEMDGIDVSFIVDLCEAVDKSEPLLHAMQVHADDVQDVESIARRELLTTEHEVIAGHEFIRRIEIVKRKGKPPLLLVFGLFRLKEHSTDVFLSYIANLSLDLNFELPSNQDRATSELPSLIHRGAVTMRRFVETFKLVDDSLFA